MTTELTTQSAAEISRTFTPLGSSDPVTMTIAKVRELWAVPTKSGKLPTDRDLINFIELCAARGLDPRVQDAYLVGYDAKDGATFSLITAHQALLKRCEASPRFRGRTSGVVVLRKAADAEPVEREGTIVFPGETLLGGWARIKLDGVDDSYHSVNLAAYNQGFGRWNKDAAGMIVKCAEGGAIRKALPTQLAGCYMAEEMQTIEVSHRPASTATTAAEALKRLPETKRPEQEAKPPEQPAKAPEPEATTAEVEEGLLDPSPYAGEVLAALAECKTLEDVTKVSKAIEVAKLVPTDHQILADHFDYMRSTLAK